MPLFAPSAASTRRADAWASLARRFAINQVACAAITLLFWLPAPAGSFWITAGYSFAIGNCCWAIIDGARALLSRWRSGPGCWGAWPGWGWMVPVVLIGTPLGYAAGASIADAWFGVSSPGLLTNRTVLVASIIFAVFITYHFYFRERLLEQRMSAIAAERLAAQTRLQLLRSQLDPHMLFNTLANLRVLIGLDPGRAQAVLDQLIAFLRSTLDGSRAEQHPLEREFATLAAYLELMSMRMGPRLAVRFDLPDALRHASVPALLLQPLVENSVKHGLEPQAQGGTIEVGARQENGTLALRVRDDGAGYSPAVGAPPGFGLTQVRERLATLYGTGASLDVRAAADGRGGTEAIVRIPLITAE